MSDLCGVLKEVSNDIARIDAKQGSKGGSTDASTSSSSSGGETRTTDEAKNPHKARWQRFMEDAKAHVHTMKSYKSPMNVMGNPRGGCTCMSDAAHVDGLFCGMAVSTALAFSVECASLEHCAESLSARDDGECFDRGNGECTRERCISTNPLVFLKGFKTKLFAGHCVRLCVSQLWPFDWNWVFRQWLQGSKLQQCGSSQRVHLSQSVFVIPCGGLAFNSTCFQHAPSSVQFFRFSKMLLLICWHLSLKLNGLRHGTLKTLQLPLVMFAWSAPR